MPVLEMALFWANAYHGLRRFLVTESRTVGTQMPAPKQHKKSRNCRRHIGRMPRSRYFREILLTPSQESVKSEFSDFFARDNFTASLTSCQEQTRLEVMPNISSHLLKRQQLQRRLQERSLILNAMDLIQVHWSNWWPALVAASVHICFGSPRLCHTLMGFYDDEEEGDPPLLVLVCFMRQGFTTLCKRADMAICSAGSAPNYRTTSAAMELIDIRELYQQINNALVEQLLNIPETEICFIE